MIARKLKNYLNRFKKTTPEILIAVPQSDGMRADCKLYRLNSSRKIKTEHGEEFVVLFAGYEIPNGITNIYYCADSDKIILEELPSGN